MSSGSRDSSLVHPREVFREAALAAASAIVLFHNHPSGDATPSDDDFQLTRRLVLAGRLMGIEVVDHVILADNRYASLKMMGRI
jgi:DNA repair protein RadC